MNCKPGDLAIYVGEDFDGKNVGALFRVIREGEYPGDWYVENVSSAISDEGLQPPGQTGFCEDCVLRPIRDNDGEDETLAWAGKPQEVTQ